MADIPGLRRPLQEANIHEIEKVSLNCSHVAFGSVRNIGGPCRLVVIRWFIRRRLIFRQARRRPLALLETLGTPHMGSRFARAPEAWTAQWSSIIRFELRIAFASPIGGHDEIVSVERTSGGCWKAAYLKTTKLRAGRFGAAMAAHRLTEVLHVPKEMAS